MTTTKPGLINVTPRPLNFRLQPTYSHAPEHDQERAIWGVETVLSRAFDYDDPDLLRMLATGRPDLTQEQFAEAVGDLYDLADEVVAFDHPWSGDAHHAAIDEYRAALTEFVRPRS